MPGICRYHEGFGRRIMRIQIASDLHLEFLRNRHPRYRIVEPADAEVLVLAGDISDGKHGAAHFNDWPVPVVYVHGNHEFYGDEYHGVRDRMSKACSGSVRYLENEQAVIAGVRFLGCCLWTDYALYGCVNTAMAKARECMYDHHEIRYRNGMFEPAHALALHQHSRRWLEKKLDEPYTGKTVVVTHHAPHPNSVHAGYRNDPGNPGFVSDLTPLMGKAALWIHGHTHTSFHYSVNGTEVVANPCGYLQNKSIADPALLQFENPDFNPQFVVAI
jgi:predicted phosphodiesterase